MPISRQTETPRLHRSVGASAVLLRVLVFLLVATCSYGLVAQEQNGLGSSLHLNDNEKKTSFRFDKKGGVVFCEFEPATDGEEPLQLKCDVYIPRGDGPFPAILAVHGGAWRSGSKLNLFRHTRRMAKAGYVVVAINYRHAPKHKFPAQVHDVKYAIAWMRKNCDEYKIDPDRIGAWGYSAGGHLVSMLGVTDKDDGFDSMLPDELKNQATHVSAVAAGGAPGDLQWIPDDSMILAYWLGDSRNEIPDTYKEAEPLSYADKDDPPFMFFHGSDDHLVPVRGSKRLHQKLEGLGVRSEYLEILGRGHIDTFTDMDTLDRSIEFFDSILKDEARDSEIPTKESSNKSVLPGNKKRD